jgi:hypothetical protein
MIACDRCRDVSKRAGEFRVSIGRVDESTNRATVHKSSAVELCDACADIIWAEVAALIRALTNGGGRGAAGQ